MVVDLDLESPGAGPFIAANQQPDLGVVDFLIEERIQPGAHPFDRFFLTVPLRGAPGGLTVFPAGRVDEHFVEKLGRIDLQGVLDPTVTVRGVLKDGLLARIRHELRPEVILLDARAGLHDLGGVSLSGLSHLEILFGFHSEQSWLGLERVVAHLGRLRADWVRLAHAMVPPPNFGGDRLHEEFRARAYDVLSQTYYQAGAIPAEEDPDAPHAALRLSHRIELLGVTSAVADPAALVDKDHGLFCRWLAAEVGLV